MINILITSFYEQDLNVWILSESTGNCAAARTATENNKVIGGLGIFGMSGSVDHFEPSERNEIWRDIEGRL
jgi:hypothetical protein